MLFTVLGKYFACRLRQFGKLNRRTVYYVTAVSNDTEYMSRLLHMIDSQKGRQLTRAVVVDMSRPGAAQFDISKYNLRIPVDYIYLGK